MLKFLRRQGVKKKIYIVVAIAVVATFAVSGILINKEDKQTNSALAQLDKRKISVREYLDNYKAVQHQIDLFFGNRPEDRSKVNIKGEAWDRLLLLDYAKKENVRAADKEVIDWITSQEGFKNKGVFDDTFYKMYIERALRTTPRQFEEEIRDMLTIRKINDKLQEELKLTDEKLKELYIEHRTEKDILTASLDKTTFIPQVTTTDKDIEQLYELVKDNLTTPENVKLAYVFVPKDKADALKAALEDNTTPLEELAKKYALELKQTPPFSRKDPFEELKSTPLVVDQAFSAQPGTENSWLQTEAGSFKTKVLEKIAERKMTLDEARTELKKIFSEQKASELAVNKLKELKAKMKTPEDFEKILGEEKIGTEVVARYKKGMYPNGIWPSENLQRAVEPLKAGEISEPFDIPKGAMIVKVTQIPGFDEKKFSEEKEKFKEEILPEQRAEAMTKLLETLRDKLKLNLELLKDIFPDETPAA